MELASSDSSFEAFEIGFLCFRGPEGPAAVVAGVLVGRLTLTTGTATDLILGGAVAIVGFSVGTAVSDLLRTGASGIVAEFAGASWDGLFGIAEEAILDQLSKLPILYT